MGQWQGYLKNKTSGGYDHFLGMFFGMGTATPLQVITSHRLLRSRHRSLAAAHSSGCLCAQKVSLASCRAHCDAMNTSCGGFTFKGDDADPAGLIEQ